jgi:hypothetical protein
MLGSNPSAAAGDEGMRAGTPQLYLSLPHAFVHNAVNPGDRGLAPLKSGYLPLNYSCFSY